MLEVLKRYLQTNTTESIQLFRNGKKNNPKDPPRLLDWTHYWEDRFPQSKPDSLGPKMLNTQGDVEEWGKPIYRLGDGQLTIPVFLLSYSHDEILTQK
jgi:hypothetical protein